MPEDTPDTAVQSTQPLTHPMWVATDYDFRREALEQARRFYKGKSVTDKDVLATATALYAFLKGETK